VKKTLLFLLLVAALSFTIVLDGFAAPYSFDSNNQDWITFNVILNSYETLNETGESALWAQEADSNGYVYLNAGSSLRPRPYSIGTTTGLTDMGELNGKQLVSDFKVVGNGFQTLAGSAPTVRWVIADTSTAKHGVGTWYVSKLAVSPKLNDLTGEWQTYGMEMTADNFFLWPYGTNATGGTAATFEDVLSTYQYVGFTLISSSADNSGFGGIDVDGTWSAPDLGAYSLGSSSTFAVDNFGATSVPVPGAIWLLGSGLLGLIGVRKRYRQ